MRKGNLLTEWLSNAEYGSAYVYSVYMLVRGDLSYLGFESCRDLNITGVRT